MERVTVRDLALDPAERQVHLRQSPGRVIRLLAVDRDVGLRLAAVAVPLGVGADELDGLHKHSGRAAARVVNATFVWFKHLDQKLDHRARGVELAALLSLGVRELRKEVLVHAAQHVLGSTRLIADLDVRNHVDQLTEPSLVERWAGVILGQHAFERRVVALDPRHGVVYQLTNRRLLGLGLQMLPAGLGGHPEDVVRAILVGVFGVSAFDLLGFEVRVVLLEGVGDVLQED